MEYCYSWIEGLTYRKWPRHVYHKWSVKTAIRKHHKNGFFKKFKQFDDVIFRVLAFGIQTFLQRIFILLGCTYFWKAVYTSIYTITFTSFSYWYLDQTECEIYIKSSNSPLFQNIVAFEECLEALIGCRTSDQINNWNKVNFVEHGKRIHISV